MNYEDEDGKVRGPISLEEHETELQQHQKWIADLEKADLFGPNNSWRSEMLIISFFGSIVFILGIKFLGSDFYNIPFEYIGNSFFNWLGCHVVIFIVIMFSLAMYNQKRLDEMKSNARTSTYQRRKIIALLEKIKEMESL